ncbi:hypothetical protein [Streptomonospora salina]|uniref:Uncharacterized protein n=1 Tax=Streptomonospora salina TaxID=104205 RepID=A0A841E1Z7_9ACTN|nr:hypothetical protein [Streptomonospora salina]MBB5997145.1 hypothetical protein [Streptomonospora salina]
MGRTADGDGPRLPGAAGGAGAAALALASPALAAWAWNADVADPVLHRMYLVAWAAGGPLSAVSCSVRALGRRPRLSADLDLFYAACLAGSAVGTTAWSRLGADWWIEHWWASPISAVLAVAAFSRNRRARYGAGVPGGTGPPHR